MSGGAPNDGNWNPNAAESDSQAKAEADNAAVAQANADAVAQMNIAEALRSQLAAAPVPQYFTPNASHFQPQRTFSMNGQQFTNPFVSAQQPQRANPQEQISTLLSQTNAYSKGYADQLEQARAAQLAQARAAQLAYEQEMARKAAEAEAARLAAQAQANMFGGGGYFGDGGGGDGGGAAGGGLADLYRGFQR